MKVFRDELLGDGTVVSTEIFDIVECTYNGKDMGERSITATIKWASPIDFKVGDYVDLQMQSLIRGTGMHGDINHIERFYLYNMPTIKKTSRPMTSGSAFEHIVTFYPAQYELSCVQMRDLGNSLTTDNIIYTGFDNVTFYGGAKELMERIMLVLAEAYHDEGGNPLWDYKISPTVDEELNTSLERFPITFSGNTVMDALLKLADKEGINTTFFVNNRTIYVGYRRPFFCRVTDRNTIDVDPNSQAFFFEYGKTSHETISLDHGCLYDITKSLGKETPITKLFAYGASRNLNRYYCSDKLATGRFVNRVMLPSFSSDGKTDYILSDEAIKRFGIREGSKQFDDIYPSLRYMTYGDIRKIKYCIKVETSGLNGEDINNSTYPIARAQCYAVVPCTGVGGDGTKGVNKLVHSVPPDDIAIYVHALGKIVKVVLYGGTSGMSRQKSEDVIVPTYDGSKQIPGACFLVHDPNFSDAHSSHILPRSEWFLSETDADKKYDKNDPNDREKINEIDLHKISYTDTFWVTDLYIFTGYGQTNFNREGYSAWAWARLNNDYVIKDADGVDVAVAHDSLLVNEIVEVEPIVVEDTSAMIVGVGVDDRQKTFDIYLRDVGFKIDEQNDFGEMVFVQNGTVKVSMLDGNLAGQEFDVSGTIVDSQSSIICAYNDDGTFNDDFFYINGVTSDDIPRKALNLGAIWRIRLNRNNLDNPDYSNLNIALPNTTINAKAGDHLVLLDLFMPDIYIQAAEARLLREARKYLEANDNGSISYSVNLDKVRMQQVPAYALQVREGLRIRMRDDDLSITTINRTRIIFKDELISRTSTYETTYTPEEVERYYYTSEHRDFDYLEEAYISDNNGKNWYIDESNTMLYSGEMGIEVISKTNGFIQEDFYGYVPWIDLSKEDDDAIRLQENEGDVELYYPDNKVRMRMLERVVTETGTYYKLTNEYIDFKIRKYRTSGKYLYPEEINLDGIPLKTYTVAGKEYIYAVIEYDIKKKHAYEGTEWNPNYNIMPIGTLFYCPSKVLVEFRRLKHYEVTIEAGTLNLLRIKGGEPCFVLLNNLSPTSFVYKPTYTITEETSSGAEWRRFKFSFDLDSEFNDGQDYYPALQYVSDNVSEFVETKLIYIVESDTAEMKDVLYADFNLDSVTIKITDSTGREPASQMIKEISATLSEQQNASAWATLMNRVEKNAIESDQAIKFAETIANTARRNYKTLLDLKNHLFDPDGSVDYTFLQVMMLQVGADSMNYELDNTRTGFNTNGELVLFNSSCAKEEDGYYHFKVALNDQLRHFLYTANGGTWNVPGGIDVKLDAVDGGGKPLPYFVCIKCSRTSSSAQWICETVQHKVNEDSANWYFNWAIISVNAEGDYNLIETRGNAYMYGDNLICGKISDLAQRCYFDLTRGDFVLGYNPGDGTASLKYVDGVLTIGGLPSDEKIQELIDNYSKAIGGGNICPTPAIQFDYSETATIGITKLVPLEAGEKYIATYTKFEDNGDVANEWAKGVCLIVSTTSSYEDIEDVYSFGDIIETNYNGRFLYVAWGIKPYVEYLKETVIASEIIGEGFTQYLDGVMVQKGERATSYQEYVKHLTDAFEGSTDIAGGLIATSLIKLRNQYGSVVAGLSGLGDSTIDSYGVSMWSGGTYDQALAQASSNSTNKELPILFTKKGIGSSIGCFEVLGYNEVAIYSQDRNSRILLSASDGAGRACIKLQTNSSGTFIDNVSISDESIDTSIVSRTLKGNTNLNTIKNAGEVWSSFSTNETVVLDGTSFEWTSNMNDGQKIEFAMLIHTALQVKRIRFGSNSYLRFCKKIGGNLVEDIWSKDISGIYETSIDKHGSVSFVFNLENITSKLGPGTYYFEISVSSFVRTNSAGVDYTESIMSDRFTDGTIFFGLLQNVSFTKVTDGDTNLIKIGKDGIKIAANSGSNFIVKSEGSFLDVKMNGLPKSAPSTAGSLWLDGNILKIS